MATVDKTTGGTAGHPSTRRKPYLGREYSGLFTFRSSS